MWSGKNWSWRKLFLVLSSIIWLGNRLKNVTKTIWMWAMRDYSAQNNRQINFLFFKGRIDLIDLSIKQKLRTMYGCERNPGFSFKDSINRWAWLVIRKSISKDGEANVDYGWTHIGIQQKRFLPSKGLKCKHKRGSLVLSKPED